VLSARSLIASLLLGSRPPRLAGGALVRAAELFGQGEGATRVALSRMVAAGELVAEGGTYALAGTLLVRHAEQQADRSGPPTAWDGTWEVLVAGAEGGRPAGERAALRRALAVHRLAPWREGV